MCLISREKITTKIKLYLIVLNFQNLSKDLLNLLLFLCIFQFQLVYTKQCSDQFFDQKLRGKSVDFQGVIAKTKMENNRGISSKESVSSIWGLTICFLEKPNLNLRRHWDFKTNFNKKLFYCFYFFKSEV